jgi:glutamine amidotransferase
MVGIINADIGNLRSVTNAVDALGFEHILVDSAGQLGSLSHLILPGVGSYHEAMKHIERLRLRDGIVDFAASGRPLLGICLGMQLLSEVGEEVERTSGLGLLPGTVRHLPVVPGVRIPHVGWNSVTFSSSHPVLSDVKSGADFYFVHSYHFECPASAVLGTTEYGLSFCSIIGQGNVVGFQFHPEKSQVNGLKLLENFCGWDGRC